MDTIWVLATVVYDIIVGDEVAFAADRLTLAVPYVSAGATKVTKITTKLVSKAKVDNVIKICLDMQKMEVTYKYFGKNTITTYRKHFVDKSFGKDNEWIKKTACGKLALFMLGYNDV